MLPLLIPLLAAAQVPPRDAVALTGEDQVREICAALRDEPAREPALGVEPSKARAQVLSRVYRLRVPATGFGFGRYREEHQELELNGDRPLRAIEDALSLDLQGIACSGGSACQSGSTSPSHVLEAIGVPVAIASSAIRMSLGVLTTDEAIDRVAEATRVRGIFP